MLSRCLVPALLLVSLLPVTATALDLNHHKAVTRVAMKSFQLCLAHNKQTDLLTAGAHKIIEGAKLEALSPPHRRYFNWHFHDAWRDTEHALGSSFIGVERSIHNLHDERIAELLAAIEVTDVPAIYETTGRILNHMHNMVVPANVAPIYHEQIFDLAEPDPFSTTIMWKNPRYIWQKQTCKIDADQSRELTKAIPALLDSTAERTRNKIREQITSNPDHKLAGQSWEALWLLRDPGNPAPDTIEGFSDYGHLGRDGFPELCRSDRELCERFFNARYADAVDASVRTLLMINTVLNEQTSTATP